MPQHRDAQCDPPAGDQPEEAADRFLEIRELARTAGADIVAEMLQRRVKPDGRSYIGKGKVEELTSLIKERPHDPEGYRLLAVVEGEAQNPAGAVQALKNAVRLAPGRSDLWEMLGEALVAQSGGDVTDDARRAFLETLKTDPGNMTARFHLARAQILTGDRDGGLAQWTTMLGELTPDDPRRAALLSAIAGAEAAPPPSSAGPVFSAEQLTAIKGMVAGLAAKLKANPENPDGWVRLVRAYAVLGETAERDAALKAARARYAGRADVMDQLTQAAAAARPTP